MKINPLMKEFSPSRLQNYATCPNQFYFKYIEKLPSPTNGAAHQGSCFHRAIEESWKFKTYNTYTLLPPVLHCKEIFAEAWDHPKNFKGEEVEIDWKGKDPIVLKSEGLNLVDLYLNSPEWQNLFPTDFEKEVIFLFDTRSHLICEMANNEEMLLNPEVVQIKNRLDVLIDSGFMDMKTSRTKYTEFDVISKLQFNLYSIAYLVMKHKSDCEFIYPVKNRCDVLVKNKKPYIQSISSEYNNIDLAMTIKYLAGLIRGIQNEVFYPNPGMLCANYCAYRDLCQPRAKTFVIESE